MKGFQRLFAPGVAVMHCGSVTLRRVLAGAVALGLWIAVGGVAEAGPPPRDQVVVKGAKSKSGPFKSTITMDIGVGDVKLAFLKVKSLSGQPETVDLLQPYDPPSYNDRYFTPSDKEITDKVRVEGGVDLTVKPGRPKRLRVRIKRTGAGSDCIFVRGVDDELGVASPARFFFNANFC